MFGSNIRTLATLISVGVSAFQRRTAFGRADTGTQFRMNQMDKSKLFVFQTAAIVQSLPIVARCKDFVLEKYNAINLFPRNLPRFFLIAVWLVVPEMAASETWRGLIVAPENRCSPYDRKNYPYTQSVEQDIVRELGAIYGPYTGTCFDSTRQTDIEHIVAMSEAHDSGLCARGPTVRRQFAGDIRNLTLASPEVNRNLKSSKDAADWIPAQNKCWFAARVVEVRRAYELTIDRYEANALERIISRCDSFELEPLICHSQENRPAVVNSRSGSGDTLALYDDNGNGRITCKEARRHGIAPVPRTHPAYSYMHDGDGDGMVCE